ncbi:hypothetical protein VNO77_27681 [Canavalia gladiata]|uniref:Uncharacterized protein n=1 Tax=Canavalia gladiata TaxID=3824 RepID=A0AAN9KZA9_CANGL
MVILARARRRKSCPWIQARVCRNIRSIDSITGFDILFEIKSGIRSHVEDWIDILDLQTGYKRMYLFVMNTMSTKSFGTQGVLNAGHTLVGACNRLAALVPVKPSRQARAYIVVVHDEADGLVLILQKTSQKVGAQLSLERNNRISSGPFYLRTPLAPSVHNFWHHHPKIIMFPEYAHTSKENAVTGLALIRLFGREFCLHSKEALKILKGRSSRRPSLSFASYRQVSTRSQGNSRDPGQGYTCKHPSIVITQSQAHITASSNKTGLDYQVNITVSILMLLTFDLVNVVRFMTLANKTLSNTVLERPSRSATERPLDSMTKGVDADSRPRILGLHD